MAMLVKLNNGENSYDVIQNATKTTSTKVDNNKRLVYTRIRLIESIYNNKQKLKIKNKLERSYP